MNVLVTASGSAIGQGIIKSIKLSGLDCKIVTTDAQHHAAGLYRGDVAYLVSLASSPKFLDEINEICEKEKIDLVAIGTDYELEAFAKSKLGVEVIVSSSKIIDLANDKWLTNKFLEENGFPAIPTVLVEDAEKLVEKEGYPIIVKPRIGDSSKDAFVVKNKGELNKVLSSLENTNEYIEENRGFIVQKYFEGEEYTSTTVTFDEKCYGVLSMEREMRYSGHTTKATIKKYDFDGMIKEIAEKLNPFGPCNFQFILHEGKPFVFEINCRFSGTTATAALVGFNTFEAFVKHMKGENVSLGFEEGVMIRYFNEVFVPIEEVNEMKEKKTLRNSKSRISNM